MLVLALLFGVAPGAENARISAETPVDFSIQLCSHQRHHIYGHMQYLPQPPRYCVAMKSSKAQRDLVRDQQSTVSIKSNVLFTWRQVTSAQQCRFGFKGYQGEYRLAPDFGAYEECQYSLSRHTHALSEVLAKGGPLSKSLKFNSSNPDCPINELPTTYADYVSCSLNANEWYILDWHSSIRYETYHNGVYGAYYANHSTSFVFQPTDELQRNGSEAVWLARLLHLETKTNGCDQASVLARFDEYWPYSSSVDLHYFIRDGRRILYEGHLVTTSVERWLQYDFALRPQPGVHEICAQIIGLPHIRHRVCHVVVDRLECPFPANSPASTLPPTVIYLAAFMFFHLIN
ncbi:unnamed protein product [Cylicocyclus nassatus]|uniref:Uncharacterized protein n=1 Tax=Cylicocyclus nassatus TaxID=53992 RepID=A0AA36GKK2_CYLNA|nr:unnamed protein product [Cylicocyclus nassatus]